MGGGLALGGGRGGFAVVDAVTVAAAAALTVDVAAKLLDDCWRRPVGARVVRVMHPCGW